MPGSDEAELRAASGGAGKDPTFELSDFAGKSKSKI